MGAVTVDEVVDVIREQIYAVIGEEWRDETPVAYETSFGDELEFESIEIVALSERLNEIYGDQVNFVAWLSEMELDEIIDLRVGTLAEFITKCLS